ncbi:MAG TPA: hypothetical protein VHD90_11355 [Phototrophicaceae bacterium]|nr:hypothetical protein [Phototrophicaceae bacterium]
MLERPVYLRIPTENEEPLFQRHSCAEVIIGAVMKAEQTGWMQLHGFVVLPETLELVVTPLKVGVSALVGYLESETIPHLSILLPGTSLIWNRYFMRTPLDTQRALDARLKILLLSPVAHGLADTSDTYAYSSANPRYAGSTSTYTGFQNPDDGSPTSPMETQELLSASHDDPTAAQSES